MRLHEVFQILLVNSFGRTLCKSKRLIGHHLALAETEGFPCNEFDISDSGIPRVQEPFSGTFETNAFF